MRKPRISLCMIVKDEEDCISRCLNSVKGIVDEIIIVDTGSKDRTIEICQSYQCRIEKFPWNGSFADARNHGIEKATGDWILWLDADEEVDETDKKWLLEGEFFQNYDVLSIHLINYHGDQVDINNATTVAHDRLFRNSGVKFTNKIHERLELDHIPKERFGHLNVRVHHYGYMNSIVQKKGKTDRNLKLLEEQIKAGENVHWAHYFIALEHYNKQQFQEALDHLNLSILLFLGKRILPPSMIYKLKYFILIAMERYSEALPGIEKAIALYPDYVDLQFYKGIILYNLNEYETAIKSFEKCIEMGEANLNHLVLKGVGSFQAWYYISLCQQKLNKKEEAVISIGHALLIAPEYKDALETLTQFLMNDEVLVHKYIEKHFQGEDLQLLKNLTKK